MTPAVERLLHEAMQLSDAERNELVDRLFETVSQASDVLDPEWEAEIKRRIDELGQGKAKSMSWEDARRRRKQDDDETGETS